jgi:hypothetical protein
MGSRVETRRFRAAADVGSHSRLASARPRQAAMRSHLFKLWVNCIKLVQPAPTSSGLMVTTKFSSLSRPSGNAA